MNPGAAQDRQRGSGRWRRRLVRWAAFGISLVLAVPLVSWPSATLALPALSPFVAVGAWLGGADMSSVALAAAGVAAVCVGARRFFCRYICPLGLLIDCAAAVPVRKLDARSIPRLGYPIVITTWAGAAVGLPLFLWLDPLAQFSALCGNRYHDWMWALPASLLAISIVLPRSWCTRVCPLGATQDLLRLPGEWCRAHTRQPVAGVPCPASPPDLQPVLRRRTVLSFVGLALSGGIGAAVARQLRLSPGQRAATRLRPPGAVHEDQFAALCIRCGNCLQACPAAILHPDLTPVEIVAFVAPEITFKDDYCREDCYACTQVCPSGAIQRLDLDGKLEHKIGMAAIEYDLCLLAFDRECEICKRVCPREAVAFHWLEAQYALVPQIAADRCNGCGACLIACPGDNAWEREADPLRAVRKAISITAWPRSAGTTAPEDPTEVYHALSAASRSELLGVGPLHRERFR